MPYVSGIIPRDDLIELVRRGWEPERFQGKIDHVPDDCNAIWVQFWVDSSVLDVMTGPDWAIDASVSAGDAEAIVDAFIAETAEARETV